MLFSCNPIGQLCLGGPSYSRRTVNRLKPRAETITREEHEGFIAGRSTTEQIFNLRIPCERYLQHQQDLYHVFVDFKKAFDRVWHKALWSSITLYNINANLIQVIAENLYNKATSAVYLNGEIGDWFRTTVGVRQGCLLSLTLFNIFRERIITEALEDHKGTVNIGGRTITNLHFANNIDGLAGKEEELASLVNRREKDLLTLWKLPQRRPNWRQTTTMESELTSGSTADDLARLASAQSSQIKVPSLKYCSEQQHY